MTDPRCDQQGRPIRERAYDRSPAAWAAERIIGRGYLKITTAFALTGAIIAGTATASWSIFSYLRDREDRDKDIVELVQDMKTQMTYLSQSVAELSEQVGDRWRMSRMYIWCDDTEAINEGWRCGPVYRGTDE